MSNDVNNGGMLREGTMLHGTYRIDGYLASGGFGNTYLATNIEFNERYAIKEYFWRGVSERDNNSTSISVSNAENQEAFIVGLNKFKKEARRIRKLNNKHIVHVYDLFEENGTAYYAMDYIDGESLKARMARIGHPLSEREVLDILDQLLDALETVHNAGILHLDLKPSNIMVDHQGVAKLIDFGASKQQTYSGGATASTAISLTTGYAPREQMEMNPEKFGPWTDFYALGATLYNLLTGNRPPLPSDIDDDETSDKHVALPMPDNVSNTTKSLILWLMNTNRKRRPQSVDQIKSYLGARGNASQEPSYNNSYSAAVDDESTQFVSNQPNNQTGNRSYNKLYHDVVENEHEEKTIPLFAHPLSYHGRIRRLEFWLSGILAFFFLISFIGFLNLLDPDMNEDVAGGLFAFAYIVLSIWLYFFQGAKRCHDYGDSGWWQLVPLYPLYQAFKKGDKGPNNYGDDPKGNVGCLESIVNFFMNNKVFSIGFIIFLIVGYMGLFKEGSNSDSGYYDSQNNTELVDTDSVAPDYIDSATDYAPNSDTDEYATPADTDEVW